MFKRTAKPGHFLTGNNVGVVSRMAQRCTGHAYGPREMTKCRAMTERDSPDREGKPQSAEEAARQSEQRTRLMVESASTHSSV